MHYSTAVLGLVFFAPLFNSISIHRLELSILYRKLSFLLPGIFTEAMMQERRHSLDIPISKTLLALRRVKSLRDPSTNSTSKLYAPVDNFICDVNSITLAFGDGCVEKGIDHKHVPNQKAVTEKDSLFYNDSYDDKGLALTCISPSSNRLGGELSQGDSLDRYVSAWKMEQRQKSRSFRMVLGDNMSDLDSPCLITHEGLSDTLLIENEGIDYLDRECGCGISSCWSGTPRFRGSNLLLNVENQPLLSGEICETEPCREGKAFKYLKNEISRYSNNPQSLSQKFRPRSFADLAGQNVVARSLLKAISSAKISSIYLFHGPRGTGKTSASKIFAAALNCLSLQEDKPCGLCRECVFFFSGRSRDVVEVDSVRINHKNSLKYLIKQSIKPPISSRFKIFIIDECHLLQHETWLTLMTKSTDLLHVVFLMITPDLTKLPQCAISRSEIYHFPKINEAVITERLANICREEGLEFECDALDLVANKSNGSLRDAEMTLEHLSLLGKKITMSLVYELIGIVSDDDLLELLNLALSSDSSKTIRRARELMGSGIDPMQLISQLATLVMDILAGKLDEGSSDIRRKFFSTHNSEASLKQLSNALKILSEAEKQLKMSKCQATWLTVALLQFNSVNCSFVELSDLRSCVRTTHQRDGDFCSRSSTSESLKHVATCDFHDNKSYKLELRDSKETLQTIWRRAVDTCQSSSLKSFFRKEGILSSVCFNQGVAVAQLEFHHRRHVKKAEKSWKSIATALQTILGCNVEIRISLMNSAPTTKSAKTKIACPNFFYCSYKPCEKSPCTSEIETNPSNISSSAPEKITVSEDYVENSSSDPGPNVSQNCCLGSKGTSTIRSSEGNALSIETRSNDNYEGTHNQVVERKPNWFSKLLKIRKKANSPNASRSSCARSQQQNNSAPSISANPSTEAYLAFCT